MLFLKNTALLVTSALLLTACGQTDTPEIVQNTASAPAPAKFKVKVISDAATIESMRPEWRTLSAQIDLQLSYIAKGFTTLQDSELKILDVHSEQVVPKLRAMIAKGDDPESIEAAVNAALVLLQLGNVEGGGYLQKQLSLDGKSAATVLRELELLSPELFASQSTFAPSVVALLSSTDRSVKSSAIAVAAEFEIKDAISHLERMLKDPTDNRRFDIAKALSHFAPSAASLNITEQLVFDDKRTRGTYALVSTLENYLNGSDEELAAAARAVLVRYWQSEVVANDSEHDRKKFMRLLVENASANELPVLHELWEHEFEFVSKGRLLVAMARVEGEETMPKIIAAANGDDRHMRVYAPLALAAIYAGTQNEEAVNMLLSWISQKRVGPSRTLVPLLDIGGPAAVNAALDMWPKLGPDSQKTMMWHLNELTVKNLAERLTKEGYIKASDYTPFDEYDQPSTPSTLLKNAGLVTWFDVESDEIPSHHDNLIYDIAENSGGAINIEWAEQDWHQSHEEDYDADYTVRFVMDNHLFEFPAENFGDWYDLGAVKEALNFALKTVGRDERVHSIFTGDQTANLLVANVSLRAILQNEYYIGFEQDANASRDAGQAFEQETIERLKKQYGNDAIINVR